MDTIQSALKELYFSLGGSADNVKDITDIDKLILAIAALGVGAQITAAGASELPAVKDTDAGKVLTVSAEGKWEAADLPS